jgi:N-methylhydantoinase B
MNNLTLGGGGDRPFTYYETIAGGCGATPGHEGASATHSHMTNTLNTPVEALEHACPLRVEEYALRDTSASPGSAKSGNALSGGAGIVRRIRALAPCEFGLLTERRKHPPRGYNGAPDGMVGENSLIRGQKKQGLPPKCSGRLEAGDALEIMTPSGGCA